MRVQRSSVFALPPEKIWDLVQSPQTLERIIEPLLVLEPVDPSLLDKSWSSGDSINLKTRLFGILPLGIHTITFEEVDHDSMQIQTREYEPLIKTWDHHITLSPHGEDETRYTDDVVIKAGVLTLPIWLFAQVLFRHRHRKWRQYLAILDKVE